MPPAAGGPGASGLAAELLAKHRQEEFYSSLSVTVLEIKGLRPRKGASVLQQAEPIPSAACASFARCRECGAAAMRDTVSSASVDVATCHSERHL